MSITMKGELMFPSQYLAAPDLGGKYVTVTIEKIERQALKTTKGDEDKWVMFMKGAKKKLVLNKTNARTIAELHGPKAEKWVGKQVVLFASTCQAFGKITDCIRVRDRLPTKRDEPAPEPPADGSVPWPPPD